MRSDDARPLDPLEGEVLLGFARESILTYLRTATTPPFKSPLPALGRKQGAFVTLTNGGRLRGCVGHNQDDLPLGQVVGSMAVRAAFDDDRFPPVREEEMEDIEIEISLLTPPVKVDRFEDIVVGRDGIVLRWQDQSAVFLPQVPVEQGWDRETTLEHLSRKAGLPSGCWRRDAELFVFQTEVLRESHHPG